MELKFTHVVTGERCFHDPPCPDPVVEILWYLNPLCGGSDNGRAPVCARHLALWRAEALL